LVSLQQPPEHHLLLYLLYLKLRDQTRNDLPLDRSDHKLWNASFQHHHNQHEVEHLESKHLDYRICVPRGHPYGIDLQTSHF